MTQEILDQASELSKKIQKATTILNNTKNQRTDSIMYANKTVICDDIPFIETIKLQIIKFNEDTLKDLQDQLDKL